MSRIVKTLPAIVVCVMLACGAMAVDYSAWPEYVTGKSFICGLYQYPNGIMGKYIDQSGTGYMPPNDASSETIFTVYYLEGGSPTNPVFDDDSWTDPVLCADTIFSEWKFTKNGVSETYTNLHRNPRYGKVFTEADAGVWTVQYWFRDNADNGAITDDAPGVSPSWDHTGSFTLVVDATPPVPLVVDDGFYTTSTTQLTATWDSSDPESGIDKYRFWVEDAQNNVIVSQSWQMYTGESCKSISVGGDFQEGQTYHFHVVVMNKAWAQSSGESDGVTVAESYQTYTYDDANNQRTVKNSNGTSCLYTYDERYRLRQIKNKGTSGSGITGAVLNYTVDAVSNRTDIWLNENTQTNTHYDYDALNRLWKINSTEIFTYDWVGNRLNNGTYDHIDRLGPSSVYTYNPTGSLAAFTGTPSYAFSYNAQGLLESVQY